MAALPDNDLLVAGTFAYGTVDFDFGPGIFSISGSPGYVTRIDAAGNWPMELSVNGLPPAASGENFELWLTRDGELDAVCGAFATDDDGSASIPMNAPYAFDESIGWVVVEKGTTTPLLTT